MQPKKRLGAGPFGGVTPSLLIAAGYVAVAMVIAVVGVRGGRWPVIHTVTLGVLSNLVVVFSHQFARSVTRSPHRLPVAAVVGLNVATLALLVSLPAGWRIATAAAATVLSIAVFVSYRVLRRIRRSNPEARFAWLVRSYERAHGAFLHGALLGALMGVGVLTGPWYATARLAHLHVNVAGWIGVTLAATLVFFAPAMLRTRIPPEAEGSLVPLLRRGTTGLTVGVVALLASAAPPPFGTVLRLGSAAGLALYAVGIIGLAGVTIRLSRAAQRSSVRGLVVTAVLWFAGIAVIDVVVVATGAWRWLDPLGSAFAAGVALPVIVAVVLHLLPSLRGRSFTAREVVLARTARGAGVRAVLVNAGAAAIAAGALTGGSAGAVSWRLGWLAAAAVVLWTALIAALPVARNGDAQGSAVLDNGAGGRQLPLLAGGDASGT